MEKPDVVIIGAGVAGLFAAYKLMEGRYPGRITLIEQGFSAEERERISHDEANASRQALQGVGGPGFFTDGKLCLDEQAGTRLIEFIKAPVLNRYVEQVMEILKTVSPNQELDQKRLKPYDLQDISQRLKAAGLTLSLAYNVIPLGSDVARRMAVDFESYLRQNGQINLLTRTTVRNIERHGEKIKLTISSDTDPTQTLWCRYLITAIGKSGHDWLHTQLDQWGVQSSANSPDLGVRVEFPANIIQPLISVVPNPRIKMDEADGYDGYMKTHCWCYRGRVTTYDYLRHPIVTGERFSTSSVEFSSLNLLYRYKTGEGQDSIPFVREQIDRLFQLTQGHPVVQTLGALRGKHTPLAAGAGSATGGRFREACLRELLPQEIIKGVLEFLKRLDNICPGIADDSTLIYAPAIEWDTYRLATDEYLRPKISDSNQAIPNIYTVGDGAGLSQGVISAATSGLIAANHLLQEIHSREDRQPEPELAGIGTGC